MAWGAAAGQVLGAEGNAYQGEAAAKNAEYNAQVAEQNAKLTREQSIEEARRSRVMARKVIGDARANYSASGIGLQGSALDVLGESAATAELDALTIVHDGENKARMYESEANQDRNAGKAAKTGGYLGASGNLAQAGGSAYGAYGGKSGGSNLTAGKVGRG